MKGNQLKSALAIEPRPQRLSPGVYRGAAGQLVNQQGKMLPNQPQRMPSHSMQPQPQQGIYKDPGYFQNPNLVGNVVAGIGRGMQPWQQSGPIFAGGSPNFNEMTGQYDPAKLAVTQAAMRGMQQFGQMPGMENQQFGPYQQYQQQQPQQFGQPQQQPFNPNTPPPQPGMQMQYGMTGKPIGWGFGTNQS